MDNTILATQRAIMDQFSTQPHASFESFLDSPDRAAAMAQVQAQWFWLKSHPHDGHRREEMVANRVTMAYLHQQYPPDLEMMEQIVDAEI